MDIPTATAIMKVEVQVNIFIQLSPQEGRKFKIIYDLAIYCQVPQQERPDCAFFTLSTMERIITGVNEAVSLESLVQVLCAGLACPYMF
jgi:hypothetical protein